MTSSCRTLAGGVHKIFDFVEQSEGNDRNYKLDTAMFAGVLSLLEALKVDISGGE